MAELETMNMMSVNLDIFTEQIREELEDENYNPFIGIGKSGVGKTVSIYELTKELGIGYCELRLVTMTEIDLLGIPEKTPDGRTTYASNELLPDAKRDGESGILVLDEITSASPTIRAAAYQLLDSKRALGNYKLPPKWKVVALGNGISDGGCFNGMEAAFLSRATCYRIEPDLPTWKKWAIKNNVNPAVIAFLTFDPSYLHVFNPDEMASVFPCPRSWTALSTKLNAREKHTNNEVLPVEKVELYAAGSVGAQIAPMFAAFYDYKGKTISPEAVLAGSANGADAKSMKPEAVYLAIQQVIKLLKSKSDAENLSKDDEDAGNVSEKFLAEVINGVRWMMDLSKAKLDYSIAGFNDMGKALPVIKGILLNNSKFDEQCPDFFEFASKSSVVLTPQ